MFPLIDELTVPYRWQSHNSELGDWLFDVRRRLETGSEIDFASANGIIRWIKSTDYGAKIKACYETLNKEGVVAICDGPWRCPTIAKSMKNHYMVLESVGCPDLLEVAENIESNIGVARLACVVDLARNCFTGMATLQKMLEKLKNAAAYHPRSLDKQLLWKSMQAVVESDQLATVEVMMSAIEGVDADHFYKRHELWREMKRTLQQYVASSGKSLRETAWAIRDNARRNGHRVVAKRILATPLLIKGLEFNHALLLDADQMETPEELYVALTRGTMSLTVLSDKPVVRHAIPTWITEKTDARGINIKL
jgi:hypothetical protein